jgi:hypothetical protein
MPTARSSGARAKRPRLGLDVFVLIGLCLASWALALRFEWVCDDAYITFRYARNWALGPGLVFNPGESPPVEGYSNFLWMALCALLEAAGMLPALWAPRLSAFFGLLLVLAVERTLRRSGASRGAALFGAAIVALSPLTAVWSTSGLETMPFAFCLFASFDLLILSRARGSAWLAGCFGLLVTLLRTEGVLWELVVAALALLALLARPREPAQASGARRLGPFLAVLLLGWGAFAAWHHSTYGGWFSNTAQAKLAFSSAFLGRGLRYVGVQAATYVPLLLIPLAPLWAARQCRARTGLAVALAALAFPAYAVVVSGDFMAFARLLVPALPFLAVLLGWLADDAWRAAGRRRAWVGCAGVGLLGVGLLPAWDVHVVPADWRAALHFRWNSPDYRSERQQWADQRRRAGDFVAKGAVLRAISRPGDSTVEEAIGAVSYHSGLVVFDRLGLVSREVAALPIPAELTRSPGHDKWVGPEFFLNLGQRPTYAESVVVHFDRPATFAGIFARWAADLARRPELEPLYEPDFQVYRMRGEPPGQVHALLLLRLREGAPHDTRERLEALLAGRRDSILEVDVHPR